MSNLIHNTIGFGYVYPNLSTYTSEEDVASFGTRLFFAIILHFKCQIISNESLKNCKHFLIKGKYILYPKKEF